MIYPAKIVMASLSLAMISLCSPFPLMADEMPVLEIESSQVQVDEMSEISLPVEVKEVPPGSEAVLEFTAWYQAPRILGYYSALQVFWNGEELTEALDRPDQFPLLNKPDSHVPSRREGCWVVAVLPKPEAARSPRNRYTVDPAIVDIVKFQLPVNISGPGQYEVRLLNRKAKEQGGTVSYEVFPTLMLQDVQLRFIPARAKK